LVNIWQNYGHVLLLTHAVDYIASNDGQLNSPCCRPHAVFML